MDAAGKDSTIKHVMSGVNPQGVQVTSFKAPGPEELAHDFLWRANRALPARGHIGIFNRSHYEEVLVVRVHPELLDRQHLPNAAAGQAAVGPSAGGDRRLRALPDPPGHGGAEVLPQRLEAGAEAPLPRAAGRDGQALEVQPQRPGRARLLGRLPGAYQEAIAATAAPHAPWFVVPADNKWFTRLIVVAAMIEAIEALDLNLPALTARAAGRTRGGAAQAGERAGLGRGSPIRRRVVIRMLIDGDARQILGRRRPRWWCAPAARQAPRRTEVGEPALDAVTPPTAAQPPACPGCRSTC